MKQFFLMQELVIALLLSGCESSASHVETLISTQKKKEHQAPFFVFWHF